MMKLFFPILAAGLLLLSCADSGKKQPEKVSPTAPAPVPTPSVSPTPTAPVRESEILDKYYPRTKHEWWAPEYFPNLNKADIPAADDYFAWFESIYDVWDKTIVTGYSPKTYLARFPLGPDEIHYIDETKGAVPGMEKLKSVFPEMVKRCPSLADPKFKAPLIVRWQDRNQPGTAGSFLAPKVNLNQRDDGTAWPAAPLMWASEIEIKGEYVRPANNPDGWYGYQYPKQTFSEITGGKTWAEGASVLQAVDKTFAHELGHFFVQAWALNTGRSPTQSFMFSEFFAELVRNLCWGGYFDDPTRVQSEIDRGKSPFDPRPFGGDEQGWKTVSRRYQGVNYALYSIDSLIAWEKQNNRFDADRMLRAAIATMDSMTGVLVKDYPAFDVYDQTLLTPLLPWSRTISNVKIIEWAPMMLSRQEFLEKFCGFYACNELEFLVKADAEGNRTSEW